MEPAATMTITTFIEALGTGATSVGTAFVNLITGITPLFWADGQLTIISILALSGVILTLGFWAIDKILGLTKMGLSGISKARAKRSKRA